MPIVTNVGKADLALAGGVSGVLKASGGTLAAATPNSDYTPPDSPVLTNVVTSEGTGSAPLRERYDAAGNLVHAIGPDGRQTLTAVTATEQANAAILNLVTDPSHGGPCLDLRKTEAGGQFAFRYFSPFLEADPSLYISDSGGLYTRLQIVGSSAHHGTGENYRIDPPTLDRSWISIHCDVDVAVQVRDSGLPGARAYETLDTNGVYKHAVEFATGRLMWGSTTEKDANDCPLYDTYLYRAAAGVLATDGVLAPSELRVPAITNLILATLTDDPAIAFNGSSQYGTFGNLGVGGSVFSVSAWINPTASAKVEALIDLFPFLVLRNVSAGGLTWSTTGGPHQLTVSFPSVGAWHHLGFVSTGTTVKIYVDGSLAGTATYAQPALTQGGNTVGRLTSLAPGLYYTGQFRKLAVWNVALDDAAMAALEAGGTPSATGLLGHWPFSEGTGTTVEDVTSTHDITLVGSPTWVIGSNEVLVEAQVLASRDGVAVDERGIVTLGDPDGRAELVGRVVQALPTAVIPDATLALPQAGAGAVSVWLDEAANTLKFRVRYSDGTTLKAGEVALS